MHWIVELHLQFANVRLLLFINPPPPSHKRGLYATVMSICSSLRLFVRLSAAWNVAATELQLLRPQPRRMSYLFPPRDKLPFREIYACGGGLLVASIKVIKLSSTSPKCRLLQ